MFNSFKFNSIKYNTKSAFTRGLTVVGMPISLGTSARDAALMQNASEPLTLNADDSTTLSSNPSDPIALSTIDKTVIL